MQKKRIMRRFSISEISGVDRPAQAHARVAIMKRADDDEVSKVERPMSDEELAAFDAHGEGPVHEKLRSKYDNQLRSFSHLSPEEAFAAAFRSLSFKDRNELRAEESGEAQARAAEDAARREAGLQGIDVGKVDLAALADFALRTNAETLRKEHPALSREKAFAATCDAKAWLFKAQRDARRRQLIGGHGEEVRAEALTKRDQAFDALQKHAEELRKSDPKLSPERARVEARQRWPELAGRERAAAMEARSA
jgi:hypothetical protein